MDAIQSYQQSSIGSDHSVRLIILLYDQLLRDVRSAVNALRKHDVGLRCQGVDHAFVVLAELQGTLNLEAGGDIAQILNRFYDLLRSQLLRASVEGSPELLEKQLQNILGVREAWMEVEREQTAANGAQPRIHDVQSDHAGGSSGWSV